MSHMGENKPSNLVNRAMFDQVKAERDALQARVAMVEEALRVAREHFAYVYDHYHADAVAKAVARKERSQLSEWGRGMRVLDAALAGAARRNAK